MPDVADRALSDATTATMPEELSSSHLRARLLQLAALIVIVGVAIWLTPGLGSLRHRLGDANVPWLVVAGFAELLSALSYVVCFKYVFCVRMSWRLSYRIGMAEQAANSLLPAGGAGGLALGAWALSKGGMKAEHIARRTVAFFALTSLPNFVTLILFAILFATGLLVGNSAPGFTYGFAIAAVVLIAAVLALPRLRDRLAARRDTTTAVGRLRRWSRTGIDSLADGVLDSIWLVRDRPVGVLGGSIGYMAFDIVALGACFEAFHYTPPLGVLVVAYLIGQLGGLIPLPGGIGGIELGLVGSFAVFNVPVSAAAAAVLAYRVLQLWIPAVLGTLAFVQLRDLLRGKDQVAAAQICEPLADPIEVELPAKQAVSA
ncbi:MAG TPA: flippase-like domain-containing protein [Solirubrobacteraceae bacterium]